MLVKVKTTAAAIWMQTASPVSKAKHLLLAVLDALQKGADVVHAADALQHAQYRLVGAAMQRAVQRAHRACACAHLFLRQGCRNMVQQSRSPLSGMNAVS